MSHCVLCDDESIVWIPQCLCKEEEDDPSEDYCRAVEEEE